MIVERAARALWPDLPTVAHRLIAPPPVADLWMILYLVAKGGTPAHPGGGAGGVPGSTNWRVFRGGSGTRVMQAIVQHAQGTIDDVLRLRTLTSHSQAARGAR